MSIPRQNSILVDIGHGLYDGVAGKPPYDPGVVSPIGWQEYQVNMVTAIALVERLHMFGHAATFVPFGLSLEQRGLMARDFDVFLSIHHNAANETAQGSEAVVHSVLALEPDRDLATRIAKTVSEVLGIRCRGIKELKLAVLSGARKTNVRAAVLTEGFFVDVPGINLVDWARREGVAIARAVHGFLTMGTVAHTD